MIKKEYVNKISSNLNMTKKDVENVIEAFVNEIVETICLKDRVNITHLGVFQKKLICSKNQFSPIDGKQLNNEYYRITFSGSIDLLNKLKEKK